MNTFTAYYNFHFGSLDCIAFGSACSDHNVGSFPTFVLYKDGEEIRRFEGAKDMKGLSDFIEDVLESIKPGSRPIGGPDLPSPKDTSTKDFQGPEAAPKADVKSTKDTTLNPTVSKDIETKTNSASKALKATPVKKKPAKPTSTPNPLGTSVSLTAESFQNLVTMSQEPWFIKFYAPWCS